MSTYAARLERTLPRVRFKRPNFKLVFWDSGMRYVRQSNAWPRVLEYEDNSY